MASAELSRRVERVVGYPPLCEIGERQRREFHEALLDANNFGDLPGKWQAAIFTAEQNRPDPSGRQKLSAGAVDLDRAIAFRAKQERADGRVAARASSWAGVFRDRVASHVP